MSQSERVSFGTADYVLLAVMLSGSMAIGLFFAFSNRNQKTKVDYLLGGRQMSALPVCLSLFATFQSAIAILGIPTEMYTYGTMYIYNIASMFLSYLVGIYTVIPLLYPLKLTSVYEYLAMRYESRAVQLFGAVIGVISSLSYMTVALLAPALALETAVGVPLWLSIILVGAVGTIYTTLGGIKSVIWTDVFQSFFIFVGMFTVLIKGSIDVGGPKEVWRIGKETGRIVLDEVDLDPRVRHTVWNLSFGAFFYWLSTHFSQSSVQRVVSIKSKRDAYKVFVFAIPIIAIFNLVLDATGLVLVAYFHESRCDPLAAGYIQNKNQLVPYFVIHTLKTLPGLSGLYISTIFSGALSTLSSGINSLAANTVEDFLSRFLRNKSESIVTTTTKVFVGIFGIAVIGLAYLAKEFQGPVTQITYTSLGATNGPLLGLFILGATFPQANFIGALVGCSTGLATSLWMAIGSVAFGHPAKTLPPGPTDSCNTDYIKSWNTDDYASNWTTGASSLMRNITANLNVSKPADLTSFPAVTKESLSVTLQPPSVSESDGRHFSLYDVSYVWNPLIGVLITVLIGLATSLVTNQFLARKALPEAKLLFPFSRHFMHSRVYALEKNDDELKDMTNY
ncbi:sodium-coupled monocarboxylate transporter 1 [Plakobranchus ocellatus]|uniref:Sodium-coupled monocarboxylate transporter 1 n=1 Tax=Plakobranchus ocellatus TaxID=259542 RepID=A0AAV3XSJ0_9GAST|nr:sodium-coupled monocarboxylate transporter 1 [Plakobranchus ocellatus]